MRECSLVLLLTFSVLIIVGHVTEAANHTTTNSTSTSTTSSSSNNHHNKHYWDNDFGGLVLCPPGGRAFVMAWSLACEMKRKKRSSAEPRYKNRIEERFVSANKRYDLDGFRPATLTEIMNICCDAGCEIRDLLAYCDPFGSWHS